MSEKLYKDIVNAASDCFGPSADRWISRLITAHFSKQPEEIEGRDIPKLVEWAKLTMGLYTDKQYVIEKFTDYVKLLEHKSLEDK